MVRVVVIGCGGIGGYYGARLAAGGADVTFLVRSEAEQLRDGGLRVDSPDGDIVLAPGSFHVALTSSECGVADVVIIALKATANEALPRLLPPLVQPQTTVAVFQNGLGVEAQVAKIVPQAKAILAGLCFVCVAKIGPTHIRHDDYGAVTLAAYQGDAEPFAEQLRATGVDAHATDDLTTARWTKLLWNIPFNGLTALLDVGTDRLLADPAGRSLVLGLMAETVAAARACGAAIDEATAAAMVARTEAMVPYRSSMALDLAVGRPLEVAAIYDVPIAAAKAAGVDVPRMEQLAALLHLSSVH